MKNRKGFALPFTIFLVTFMTIVLAAAFSRTAAEHLVAQSSQDQISALSVAQTGLSAFFHDTMTTRPASGDSIRYNVVGGYAWVFMDEVRKPADTVAEAITYVIRSEGYTIDPNQGSVPTAQRSVAQFAQWQSGDLPIMGAMTAANGLRVFGSNGTTAVYGASSCGVADTVNIIRASTTGISGTLDTANGFGSIVSGVPDSVAAWTNVNWPKINSGNYPTDYTSIQLGDSSYSSQFDANDATIFTGWWGNSVFGTGLLIVEDDLRIIGAGDFTWYGVILVGGRARFQSRRATIHGTLITGLDELTGGSPSRTEIGSWNWFPRDFTLNHDPCEIANTMGQYSGFRQVDGAWMDNWSTY